MNPGWSVNSLVRAGLIVAFVGLAIVLMRIWHVPGYWMPLVVGIVLIAVGVLRGGGT